MGFGRLFGVWGVRSGGLFGLWWVGFGDLQDGGAAAPLHRRADRRQALRGNPHGARPVHLLITMIKWIRTSRLSIKNSLCVERTAAKRSEVDPFSFFFITLKPRVE